MIKNITNDFVIIVERKVKIEFIIINFAIFEIEIYNLKIFFKFEKYKSFLLQKMKNFIIRFSIFFDNLKKIYF